MAERPFWEIISPMKQFYTACIEPVCKKYDLTRTELDILLFLYQNPSRNTAVEIVQRRYLAKSHVSTSVKLLNERGYLQLIPDEKDKRITRLRITEHAGELIREGLEAQDYCNEQILKGMSEKEIRSLTKAFEVMHRNIQNYTENRYWNE